MFARVTTYEGPPDKLDEVLHVTREKVIPGAEKLEGFEGAYLLVDRKTGKSMSISLWRSEKDVHASEEAGSRLRSQGASAGGSKELSVHTYEVGIAPAHIPAAKP
jgi:heme-degrading monooxygenase HmoA